MEYNLDITKYYCISMQKINSIKKLILKIQQTFGPFELFGHTYFLTKPIQKFLK